MPSFCPASSGVRTSSGMTVPSAEVRPRIMEKPRESPTAWPMAFTDSQGRTSYVPFAQRALEERTLVERVCRIILY